MNREVADPATDVRDLEALIDEVAAASVDIAALLHKTIVALGELLDERRSQAVDVATERSTAIRGDVLGPDVLEIATRDAQAAGVSVAEYVRTAVLEYAARSSSPSGGRDGHDARRTAARSASRDEPADG